MTHFDKFEIEIHTDGQGRRKVWGVSGDHMRSAGWLMPTMKDSRQQPKSLAYKLLEERTK